MALCHLTVQGLVPAHYLPLRNRVAETKGKRISAEDWNAVPLEKS